MAAFSFPFPFLLYELNVEAVAETETLVAEVDGVGRLVELNVADDLDDEASDPDAADCTDDLSVACLRGRKLGPGVEGPAPAPPESPYMCGSLSARSFAIFCEWLNGASFLFLSFSS